MKTIARMLLTCLPFVANAQPSPLPDRPITLIVGYSAGGSVDIVARKYALKLQERLGQPVVVENRAGASGVVAAMAVKNARPDGTTIYFVASPAISITPAFVNANFDPVQDFVPVASIVKYANVLLVKADSPFNTVEELVSYGKRNPGAITYGSPGAGSSQHLSGALLAQRSGVDMVHVPYKGMAPAVLALLAGQLTMTFDVNNTAINQVRAGSVRPLAVTSAARNRQLPDTPTMMESGFKDFRSESWIGLLLPTQAAPQLVTYLADVNRSIVQDPDFINDMHASGYEMDDVSTADLATRIRTDYRFYTDFARTIQLN